MAAKEVCEDNFKCFDPNHCKSGFSFNDGEVVVTTDLGMGRNQEFSFSVVLNEDLLEKETATHSSILAWKTPWTEEPGRLQSTGSQRVGHD